LYSNENIYWRSPEHKAGQTKIDKSDLPHHDPSDIDNRWSRRHFLGIMGASMALATTAGCRRPMEKIVPYVTQPEHVVPGVPMYYATTMPFGASNYGLIVECHEGRPTKIEANCIHPSTPGGTDAMTQAAILNLYDPDRSRTVRYKGNPSRYDDFIAFYRERFDKLKQGRGEGLAVLSEPLASPTLKRLKNKFDREFPRALWAVYEPVNDENIITAIQNITGQALRPIYHYDRADVILSLDADFLHTESEHIKAAFDFAQKRDIEKTGTMNRLYVVESTYSVTGAAADHRYRLASSHIGAFLVELVTELKSYGLALPDMTVKHDVKLDKEWIKTVGKDLVNSPARTLVVAGRRQPVWVHELVMLVNRALGTIDSTVSYYKMNELSLAKTSHLKTLVESAQTGNIKTLIIFGGNPVYNAPHDMALASLFDKLETIIHFGEYYDETGRHAAWHIPRSHFLECWGDGEAFDGTTGIIQPMIAPLYDTRGDCEFLSLLATGQDNRGYDIVRETWQSILSKGGFEKDWNRILHDGYFAGTATGSEIFKIMDKALSVPGEIKSREGLEIGFYPSSQLHDGRLANNGWMQELPDPISKLTWDNPAWISPATAKEFGLTNGDVVEVTSSSATLKIPIWIVPGLCDNYLALSLGYGRNNVGRVADGVGFDTFRLRMSDNMHYANRGSINKTGQKYDLANTQDHGTMAGRPIVREASLEEYNNNPNFANEMVEHPPLKSIYPEHDYSKGYQWGMVIDLNRCIGCNACTVACQSENNIPVVGKDQVGKGREMHWIRLDRYFTGNAHDPQIVHMPMACQHCENAPCESVCPVAATTHDKEGLNTMTYNRCIGTRYCSNNCPYKVRRFNFFNYTRELPDTVKMAQNPDVTVRFRGVMEKCTFCIQRINRNKQKAKKEERLLGDGEFMTACQQACPTRAIEFGNINDPTGKVMELKNKPRSYALLGEFNTKPRNTYLAKIRNPNPALVNKKNESAHDG
jgi:molybdopterin-containing oxidoreductase family iron-sulfur binding subunit